MLRNFPSGRPARMDEARFGTLVVIVDKARNLPNRKKIGKQDAYAIVRLGHEVQRTPTDKRAGQVPSWNHEVRFKVLKETENILKLSIFNEDSKSPDLIGDCAIDLTELYKKHEFDSWVDLRYKEKPAGEVYVELTFYYEGPPRPKPKIELSRAELLDRSAVTSSPSRGLTSVPYRRESLPGPNTHPDLGYPQYDPSKGLARMSLDSRRALPSPSQNSQQARPNQQEIRYAETWDGVRDNRIISPAPGDIRRKSFSSDRTPIPRTTDSGHRSHSSLANRHMDEIPIRQRTSDLSLPNLLPSIDSFPNDQSLYSEAAYDGIGSARYMSPVDSNTFRGRPHVTTSPYRAEEMIYAEPILDPRHGSETELRGSPSLFSSQTLQPSASHSDVKFVAPHEDRVRPVLEARHANHAAVQYERGTEREQPHVFDTTMNSIYQRGHAQVQSYSQSSRNHGEWQQYAHNKSSSASLVHGRGDLRRSPVREPACTGLSYARDLNYQQPDTYAVTPAQYQIQSRPLPVAPTDPPARPAKIPLGLTQEEYDILNG